MSAQPVMTDDVVAPARPRLEVVRTPAATVSTLGFLGIVVALIAAGMAGVMIVTTSVGAQSRELAALRTEATELGYQASALESELYRMSSANALALRASELGMVPNPYPAFINLADGTVTGEPTKASGREMPFLRGVAPAPLPGPVGAVPRAANAPTSPDMVAAGTTEGQP